MRRGSAVLMSVFVMGMVVVAMGWPYVRMAFASSAHYSQQDKRQYNYYTPDLLKEMPRLSDNYEFSYSNISGPQAFVYGLQFKGTTDTSRIRDYLLSRGYEKQKQCQTKAECWRSSRNQDVVSFYSLAELNLVSVELYRRGHNE